MIKNYVNRKITSYILWIFTKSICLHIKHIIKLTKRESVRRGFDFFVIHDPTLVNTSTTVHEKQGKVQQHWRQKEKVHICIK